MVGSIKSLQLCQMYGKKWSLILEVEGMNDDSIEMLRQLSTSAIVTSISCRESPQNPTVWRSILVGVLTESLLLSEKVLNLLHLHNRISCYDVLYNALQSALKQCDNLAPHSTQSERVGAENASIAWNSCGEFHQAIFHRDISQ